MDSLELKAQCVRKNKTLQELSQAIGIDRATLTRKLAGKSDFTRGEICTIRDFLSLNNDEIMKIFFNHQCT